MKTLLLEDDSILSDILTHHLKECGFEVVHVRDGDSALDEAYENKFDLMILDINVPKKSGFEVVKTLREYNNTTPTIIVTAYHDTTHMKNGFESEESIKLDSHITLIPTKNKLNVGDIEHQISHKECEILLYLSSHKKRVVSSEELMQNLWEYESMPSDATIKVYIKNLRNILGKDRIKTIRGSGYYFE